MEQETLMKTIGIIIVAVMAFSMIAVAFNSTTQNNQNSDTSGINTNPIVNSFDYELNFSSTAIKELNSFRMVAKTSNLDKSQIDTAIQKMDGVSKVSSEFRNNNNGVWDYFAEITLKKTANLNDILNQIFELEYFTGAEKVAMKYMTIASPGELKLYNPTLNIDRNFEFTSATLPALVSIETIAGDTITVSGSVTLRGMDITALEIIESSNQNSQPQYFSVNETLPIITLGNELLFEGQTSDLNIDQNYYTEQLALIDSTAQIYFIPDENVIRFAGQSSVTNSDAILSLFSEMQALAFYQDAEFELSSVYINELAKELTLDSNTITAQVKLGHQIGDEANLTLNVYVQRENASVMQGIEN